MGMSIEEACKFIMDKGLVAGVKGYKVVGNVINLICKSHTGRTTYTAEVVIKEAGKRFTYACVYNSNIPRFFGNKICDLITK